MGKKAPMIRTSEKIAEKYFVKFADEKQAKIWIINNQLARRNLLEHQRLMLYYEEKKLMVKPHGFQSKLRGQKDPSISTGKTSTILAKKHKVSESTIKRAVTFGKSIEKIPDNETKQKILTHEIDSTIKTVKQFADENQAKIWIINNQLARRNLTLEQKNLLLGKGARLIETTIGGNRAVSNNLTLVKYAEKHKTTRQNVYDAMKYSR